MIAGGIYLLIRSLCEKTTNLDVEVNAESNGEAFSGHLQNIKIKASRLQYNGIHISRGAALYADTIQLGWNFPSLTPCLNKPAALSATVVLSERDLNESRPIGDMFRTVLTELARVWLSAARGRWLSSTLGGIDCILREVKLIENGLTDFVGSATSFRRDIAKGRSGGRMLLDTCVKYGNDKEVNFRVMTGLAIQDSGRTLALYRPIVIWRGLQFPLLSISSFGCSLPEDALLTTVAIEDSALRIEGLVVLKPPPEKRKFSFMDNENVKGNIEGAHQQIR